MGHPCPHWTDEDSDAQRRGLTHRVHTVVLGGAGLASSQRGGLLLTLWGPWWLQEEWQC